MSTITVDTEGYIPLHNLAVSVLTITPNNSIIEQILQKFTKNPTYTPTDAEIRSIIDITMDNSSTILASSSFQHIYTLILQLIIDNSSLLNDYIGKISTQLSTEPSVETKIKVILLQFLFGKISSSDQLCYHITKAILTLLVATYQSPIQLQAEVYRNIDNVLVIITENIDKWSISPPEIAHLLNLTYTYTINSSSPFSARNILTSAYKQLGNFDIETTKANSVLVHSIVEQFFVLAFTSPSHLVSLDDSLSYETINQYRFTQSEYFKGQYPLLDQLLGDFISTTTISQVETLAISPRWIETSTKYQLNTEVLRTNLLSLVIADKIQAGKGYRFTTLQNYLGLDSTDEVEEYIVEVTTHGQISTKIDQVKNIIYVSRVVPRKFNQEKSWIEIQKRLQYFDKVLTNFKDGYKGIGV